MRIGLDIDGVLASFESQMIPLIVAITGRDLFSPDFSIQVWDWPEALGYTPAEMSRVWDTINQHRHFWDRLEECSGMAVLRQRWPSLLAVGHEVAFATARPGTTALGQTRTWLHIAGCPEADITITSYKGSFCRDRKIDCYLDDRLGNIQAVVRDSPTTRAYLLTRPYNAAAEAVGFIRVPTVEEFFRREGL